MSYLFCQVVWLDQKGDLITFRKKVYSGNRRLRIIHTNREDWSLQIRKVSESDFGRYTCLVNTNPVLTRTVQLKNAGTVQSESSLPTRSYQA